MLRTIGELRIRMWGVKANCFYKTCRCE